MSWPVSSEALETLGQAFVANCAGAVTGYHVAFGELNRPRPPAASSRP